MSAETITQTVTKDTQKVSQRSSNIELFRIITMLLIVAHHYVVNSGLLDVGGVISANPYTLQATFLLLFGAWGKVGINCFILITGYFMCKSNITAKKLIKLVGEIEFYNVAIWLVFRCAGYESITFERLIEVLLPISSVSVSFPSCFLLLYLSIPFLNILIKNMSEKQHRNLVLLLCGTYTVLGTFTIIPMLMNYFTWFIVVYFIAAYIRLYPKKNSDNTKLWALLTAVSVIAAALSVVICARLSATTSGARGCYYMVADANKPLALLPAICAFMFFKNLKIKNSKIINTIAASTFGVLMIHANSNAMRTWLWKDTLKNVSVYGTDGMFLHAIVSCLAIFAVCIVIDIVRINVIEKPLMKMPIS